MTATLVAATAVALATLVGSAALLSAAWDLTRSGERLFASGVFVVFALPSVLVLGAAWRHGLLAVAGAMTGAVSPLLLTAMPVLAVPALVYLLAYGRASGAGPLGVWTAERAVWLGVPAVLQGTAGVLFMVTADGAETTLAQAAPVFFLVASALVSGIVLTRGVLRPGRATVPA